MPWPWPAEAGWSGCWRRYGGSRPQATAGSPPERIQAPAPIPGHPGGSRVLAQLADGIAVAHPDMLEQLGTALAMSSGKNHMLESRSVTNIILMPKHASPPPPAPLLVEIGERLAATRDAVGLTQQGFANLFGCSRGAIANWEIGRSLPDIHTMMRFCERYEIPLD